LYTYLMFLMNDINLNLIIITFAFTMKKGSSRKLRRCLGRKEPVAEENADCLHGRFNIVKTIMKNHCYQFDSKLYLQQSGLKFSGVLARLVMLRFEQVYLKKLKF
jgi:hypothetical protein